MKYLLVLTFVVIISFSAFEAKSNLKNAPQKGKLSHINSDLTPSNAKAGRLTNVAPEARKMVTAQLAGPKAEIKLNINHQGVVQKTEHLATTPTLGTRRIWDPKTNEWGYEPGVISNKIYATTTQIKNMNTYHTVNIDLTNGNAIPKTGLKPKGTFGTR